MEQLRTPFQGVWNIVRFNWHFYVLALAFLIGLLFANAYLVEKHRIYALILFVLALFTTLISLFVSYYVYDLSDLYKLDWVENRDENGRNTEGGKKIVNINAGFDETSVLLQAKFDKAQLTVLDFYDPKKHTEVSIKRARNAYPPFPNTQQVTTSNLTLETHSADKIFVLFAAHEIRDKAERIVFFKELHRVLKPNGQVFVAEHLRDTANLLAYNIGFFHFLSKASWYNTFDASHFKIATEFKKTPFITVFILKKHDFTP